MGTYREILRLTVRHAFYGVDPVPVRIVPRDPAVLASHDLMMRTQGRDALVISDATDLPDTIDFDLVPTDPDIFAVTDGANWTECPFIDAPLGHDEVAYDPLDGTSGVQNPTRPVLALVRVAPHTDGRRVTITFDAVSSHWAYHVVGPDSETTRVQDPEDEVVFDPVDPVTLPDGRVAHVLRSRTPLPARARSKHRFALTKPGSFGPKTLIPVLPAAGRTFVPFPNADTPHTLVQSDIFISIF